MLKEIFVAVAIVIASPAFVSAQDFFWSFSPTAVETNFMEDSTAQGDSRSVYIFSDGLFGFDALDLVFETSNSNVVRFTGGEVFNPTFTVVGGERFHEPLISIDRGDMSGRLFLTNLAQNGVNPALSPLYDPGFDAGVGPNGAVLLARVDFLISGIGTADLEFGLGQLGAFRFPATELNPSLGVAEVSIQSTATTDPDIFLSFSPTVLERTFSGDLTPGGTGSAYIFSDGLFGFDAIDLNFAVSDSNVIRFTGGEGFNPVFTTIGGMRFDTSDVLIDVGGGSGNLFAANVTENGVNPATGPLFDPGFAPGVGPNGALLLARVDFEILGDGEANLELSLGPQGILQLPGNVINPRLGSADFGCDHDPIGGPSINLGDLDLDGVITGLDIAPFISVLASYGYQLEADCNEDCAVNFLDIFPFIQILSAQ